MDSTRWPSQCGPTGWTSLLRKSTQAPPARPDGGVVGVRVRLVPLVADHGHREAGRVGGQHRGPCRRRTRCPPRSAPRSRRRPSPALGSVRRRWSAPSRVSITMETSGPVVRAGASAAATRRARVAAVSVAIGPGRWAARAAADAADDRRGQPSDPIGEGHGGPHGPAVPEGRVLATKGGELGLRDSRSSARDSRSSARAARSPAAAARARSRCTSTRRRSSSTCAARSSSATPAGTGGGAAVHHVSPDAERRGIDVSSIPLRDGAPGAVAAWPSATR